jgi:radical SAM superfamily enzyme YgiQ (UPF0313 family)
MTMKICLCTVPMEDPDDRMPSPRRETGKMPPMAICALVRWSTKHGYSREQIDFYDIDNLLPSDAEILAYFKACPADVVGISAVLSSSYKQVKRVSRLIRQALPEAWIVMGGNLAASAETVLRKTDVDLCVAGDGEIPWVAILDYVKANGRKRDDNALQLVGGLCFLRSNGVFSFTGFGMRVMDAELGEPDYALLRTGLKDKPELIANYFMDGLKERFMEIDARCNDPQRRPKAAKLFTSKGCVAKCTFCQRFTKGYRRVPIPVIEAHLRELMENHDVGFVAVADENFGSDREHARAFGELMKKLDLLWVAEGTRVTNVTPEDIAFYRAHNCVSLTFGVESGSPRILEVMEKKITAEQVFEAFRLCAENDVVLNGIHMVLGMPGETDETVAETGRFVGRLAHMLGVHPRDMAFSLGYAKPIPGTPLYEYGKQIGVLGKSIEDEDKYLEDMASARQFGKQTFINLNGAPARDVFFWDTLAMMEATREYLIHQKREPRAPTRVGLALGLSSSQDRKRMRWWNAYREWIGTSNLLASLPRSLVQPLAKTVLYADFLLRGRIKAWRGAKEQFCALGTNRRLDLDQLSDHMQLQPSLRRIVADRRITQDIDPSERSRLLLASGL